MQLNAAGTGNLAGTCGARPTKLLEGVGFSDVYGPLRRGLEKLLEDPNDPRTRGRVHPFVWDWRLDPRPQLARLDALITEALSDELSQKQNLDEVVLVAHSAGGLLVRAAQNNAGLLKRFRRVLTIGTPYLGAPKTFFPLYAGVLEPGDFLSSLLDPFAVQKLARNLTGAFILYPSDNFGAWLRKEGGRNLGPAATRAYLHNSLHASNSAINLADRFKSDIASGFKRLEPAGLREFRVLAGVGYPTVNHITLMKGEDVGVEYVNGDKTVTIQSAKWMPAGSGGPLGDQVRISYLCRVEHLELTQDQKMFRLMGDFIRYGSPPEKTDTCGFAGFEYSIRKVGGTRAGASRARRPKTPVGTSGLKKLEKAENKGVVEVVALPGVTNLVTGAGFTGKVTIPVRRVLLTADPIGRTRGRTVTYGPLTGRLLIDPLKGGKVNLKLNGKKLKRRKR